MISEKKLNVHHGTKIIFIAHVIFYLHVIKNKTLVS
jgi:hypothetical protein